VASTPYAREVSLVFTAPTVLFTMFFFTTIGFVFAAGDVVAWLPFALTIIAFCVLVRPVLYALTVRVFGYSWRESALVGVHLTSLPVLSLVLLDSGIELGLVRADILPPMVLVIVSTILISSYANPHGFATVDRLARRFPVFRESRVPRPSASPRPAPRLVIAGTAAFTTETLREARRAWGETLAIVTTYPEYVRMRSLAYTVILTRAHPERSLEGIDLSATALAVVGFADTDTSIAVIRTFRARNRSLVIVTGSSERDTSPFRAAGADVVCSAWTNLGKGQGVTSRSRRSVAAAYRDRVSREREASVGELLESMPRVLRLKR
jgi:hypothetical protein